MTETIAVLDPISETTAARLRALLPPGFTLTHAHARGDAHLQEIIAQADYAISGQVAVSGAVLRSARRLKLLHKWGVGVDNFDLAAARACGIRVARTTGSNAVPVAEFTIGLIIATLRNLAYGHAELKRGEWRGGKLPQDSFMLSGKTVGLVGFGAIGRAVARLLTGFGCTILYNKRTPIQPAEEAALGVRHAMLPELLAKSDVVSLHCPLTPETKGLIDKAALAAMKRSAILINVARGGVVIEDDLAWALSTRMIHGAAMDVYETEPLPPNSPLLRFDNLVVTPHLAANAADNFEKSVRQIYANILCVARGEAVPAADAVA